MYYVYFVIAVVEIIIYLFIRLNTIKHNLKVFIAIMCIVCLAKTIIIYKIVNRRKYL